MKTLTTKQAWMQIAQWFDAIAHGTAPQKDMDELYGLCYGLSRLRDEGRISDGQDRQMERSLRWWMADDARMLGHWWGFRLHGRSDDGARVIAATLMSLLADEDTD
jgi:hypothetical protein